jgi:hypothetical protein
MIAYYLIAYNAPRDTIQLGNSPWTISRESLFKNVHNVILIVQRGVLVLHLQIAMFVLANIATGMERVYVRKEVHIISKDIMKNTQYAFKSPVPGIASNVINMVHVPNANLGTN